MYADVLRASQSGTTGNGSINSGALALGALKETFGGALNKCQSGCGEDFSLVGAGVNTAISGARGFGCCYNNNVRSGWMVSMAVLVLGGWFVLCLL